MGGGPSTPELVAAVSNAGGLGSLGAAYLSPSQITEAIHKIRSLTAKPFNVNLFAGGWQTGFNPVIAMELIASGAWSGAGVLGPEAFDPDPYLDLLDRHGVHHDMVEMEPGAHRPT